MTKRAYAAFLSCQWGVEAGFIVFSAKHTVGLQQVHFKMNCTAPVISVISLAEVIKGSLET